ncbi:MAG: methyltransferase domain-containing protein [Patescibacteria group bacterium]
MAIGEFTKVFLEQIRRGDTVLDLGTGSGEFSQMFADRGARVTAVDVRMPDDLDDAIVPKKMSVQDFIAETKDEQYDEIFLRNIIQFLDKQWVLDSLVPWLQDHVRAGGVVGIQTFYEEPRPPFDHPRKSLYSLEELAVAFPTWPELYREEREREGPDMEGNIRRFFIASLIVKKTRDEVS